MTEKTILNKKQSLVGSKFRRNDKCECGSGRKYKHCCGKPEQGDVRCAYCGKDATYSIELELRAIQGPALATRPVAVVCDEHNSLSFNEVLNPSTWQGIVNEWKKSRISLDKRFCNIIYGKIE